MQQLTSELKNHIYPFWMNLKDDEYGGFYGEVDEDLVLYKQADKGIIATTRYLWSFSKAYNTFKETKYLEMATHAYECLINQFIDEDHGGFYWSVDYKGMMTSDVKHVYAHAFGLYAMSEYYKATHQEEVKLRAIKLFERIESSGFNHETKTYGEQYSRDWHPIENELLSENGVEAAITMNTLLHTLEAYTTFYQIYPEGVVKNRLDYLINLFVDALFNEETNTLRVFLDKEWHEIIDLESYGHNIEAVWLIYEAMKAVGREREEALLEMILKLSERVYRVAVSKEGYIFNEREGSCVDKDAIWWVQVEAMVGFMTAYQLSNDSKYLVLIQKIWSYTKEKMIDQRDGAEWHWGINEAGHPLEDPMASNWKSLYHNSRGLIEVVQKWREKNDTSKIL